jgi:bis(5'-nucleosyl)-tetraphosphatase (symmetrical)
VPPHRRDTLDMILGAPDRDELLAWLRHRPMLHREGPWMMVHAGLPPEWSADQARLHAGELETALRGRNGASSSSTCTATSRAAGTRT